MLNEQDILNKNQLELIQLLVNDLKAGNNNQIKLFNSLVKVSLLGNQKESVEAIIQDLIQDSEHRIHANDSYALYLLGHINQHGLGVPVDFNQAIRLYEHAIALDDANAMSRRAFMHDKGQGGPVNFAAAINLFEHAIVLGNTNAISNRAAMHYLGQGGEVDFAAAIELYEQAIALGDTGAMFSRAYMHQHGQGGDVNFAAAIELYARAIALGDADAMFNRAVMHKNGQGGAVNFVAAIELYNRAIVLGNASAMNNRAYMHQYGHGGEVDFAAAIELYDRAIALGNKSAMFHRAYMHAKGQGGEVDNIKAARLYRIAMDKNHSGAEQNLERNLNSHNSVIYQYHYAMGKNDIDKVIDLLNTSYECVEEFIAFDCQNELDNSNSFERMKSILQQGSIKLDKYKQTKLYCSFLTGLNNWEKTLEIFIDDELNYLDKLSMRDIQQEKIHVIMQLVIDTWYRIDGFTENAARILSQLMHKIKLEDSDFLEQDILKNIAVILVKKIYGENYSTSFINLSMQQIMILVAFNEGPLKPTVEDINSIFGVKLMRNNQSQISPTPEASTQPEEKLALTGTGLSIFEKADETLDSATLSSKLNIP